MDEIIKAFHIDWRLMLAQIVNFAIVIFVLWKFAYKPILKIMGERSERVAKGLRDAEESERKLKSADEEKENILKQASERSQAIVEEVNANTENLRKEKLEKTGAEAQKIIAQAKEQIQAERSKMLSELKRELGELVVLASSKITKEKIKPEVNDELINQALDELEKGRDIKI